MKTLQTSIRHFRHEIRTFLGDYPKLFFPVYCVKDTNKNQAVRTDSDILIEGFPRSGNTFSVVAFAMAQDKEVRIGSHMHVPAHIYRGLKYQVPIMLLIRKPQDAVISLVMGDTALSLHAALNFYIKFYRELMPLREQIFIAKFEEVTTNFGLVIERFNQKYNTTFKPFDHTDENVNKVFKELERRNALKNAKREVIETQIARPSSVRKLKVKEFQEQLQNTSLQPLCHQANEVYEAFLRIS